MRKESLHPIEQCLGRLGSIEEVRVFRPPSFELHPLPTLGKVLLKNRQCASQRPPTQHVRVELTTPVCVRAKDSTPEQLLEVLEGLNVAAVEFDLERWLLSIARKGTLAYDEAHCVAQAELVHATIIQPVPPQHKVARFTFLAGPLPWRRPRQELPPGGDASAYDFLAGLDRHRLLRCRHCRIHPHHHRPRRGHVEAPGGKLKERTQ